MHECTVSYFKEVEIKYDTKRKQANRYSRLLL